MEVLGQGERNRGGDHRGTEKGWGGRDRLKDRAAR